MLSPLPTLKLDKIKEQGHEQKADPLQTPKPLKKAFGEVQKLAAVVVKPPPCINPEMPLAASTPRKQVFEEEKKLEVKQITLSSGN